MSRLTNVGAKFRGTLKTITGKKFRGLVVEASLLRDKSAINDYIVRIGENATIRPGEIMYYDGAEYLLGAAATEMSGLPLFRFMRMILITHHLVWTRVQTVIDPVSKLKTSVANMPMGTVHASVLHDGKIDDAFRIQGSRFRLITDSAVQLNDKVGEWSVTFIEPRYGVNFCEVK